MPKLLAVFLAVLLLALSLVAAAFGMADVYRNEAAMLIEDWEWSEEGEEPATWEQAHRYLWLANRLAPHESQVLSDLGLLYELRVMGTSASEATADLDQALGHYRQALLLRPAWPYAWADIALIKITQERLDAEFALAMQRALTLGPWQIPVQASIAGGGLAVWEQLPLTLQIQVEGSVARGLAGGSRLMEAVARRFGLFEAPEAQSLETPDSLSGVEG